MKQDTEPAPQGETPTPKTDNLNAFLRDTYGGTDCGAYQGMRAHARALERDNQRLRDEVTKFQDNVPRFTYVVSCPKCGYDHWLHDQCYRCDPPRSLTEEEQSALGQAIAEVAQSMKQEIAALATGGTADAVKEG